MKRDELVRYDGEWYDANIIDCLLDEKDAEIAALKAMAEEREKEIEFMHSNCKWYAGDGCDRLHRELMAAVGDVGKLKAEIESLKASHYADSVDAGMRERRLKRALWLARAIKAESEAKGWYHSNAYIIKYDGLHNIKGVLYGKGFKRYPDKWIKLWIKIERLCIKKAEEYK